MPSAISDDLPESAAATIAPDVSLEPEAPAPRVDVPERFALLKGIANLQRGGDIDAAVETIRKDVPLQGATVWVLVCSAMLASLGLDTSSTAVVIGAMLISPLMTPILGVGMALAVSVRKLFYASIRCLSVATVAALVTSALYFWVTPLGEATPEILARTRPTLLDVAIAFFGGVAGIVAVSRKSPTNVIPGVAIATALMPPLCVAGFGIATGAWTYFTGAFYLFFLNGVFIATATYLITRLMGARSVTFQTKEQHDRIQRRLALIVLVTAVPAGLLLFDTVYESQVQRRAGAFVDTVLAGHGREVLRWSITGKQRLLGERNAGGELRAVLIGMPLREGESDSLNGLMAKAGLDRYALNVSVVGNARSGLSRDEVEALVGVQMRSGTIDGAGGTLPPIEVVAALDTAALRRDARIVVPALDTLAEVLDVVRADSLPTVPFVRVRFVSNATARDSVALGLFLRARLGVDSLRLGAF